MFFSARNCRMLRALWRDALSWWSSHDLSCHNSRLFSHALSEAKAAGSLRRLAEWSSGPVARTHCGRCLWHRRTWSTWFDFWFWLSCFLRPRWGRRLQLTSLALGFRVLLKNPCLITSGDSTKQVWFSLKALDDVLTHLQVALLLIIIQQSPWHHSCADFPHERMCKQKHVKQNIQWLQKAKITVIYSQDIMLDDNTILLSLSRP